MDPVPFPPTNSNNNLGSNLPQIPKPPVASVVPPPPKPQLPRPEATMLGVSKPILEAVKPTPTVVKPAPELTLRTQAAPKPTPVPDFLTLPTGQAGSPGTAKEPIFTPETNNLLGGPVEELEAPRSHTLLWILVSAATVIGLVLMGYFVVYPLLTDSPTAPLTEEPTAPAPLPITEPAPHVSAFTLEPAVRISVEPATLDAATITGLLKTQRNATPNQSISEVVFKNASGQVPFATFLGALLPNFLDASSASTWFTDDFTSFVYKNSLGVWPGYVAKLKEGANVESLNQWLMALEKNDLSGFYVNPPGTLGAFRSGTYKSFSDRFSPGSSGASFNYALVNGWLVINTSFDGLKESTRLMGY